MTVIFHFRELPMKYYLTTLQCICYSSWSQGHMGTCTNGRTENRGNRLTWNCLSCLWGAFHTLPLMLVVSCPYLECWGNQSEIMLHFLINVTIFHFGSSDPTNEDFGLFSVYNAFERENSDSLGGLNPFIIKFSGHQWLRELTEVWFQSSFGRGKFSKLVSSFYLFFLEQERSCFLPFRTLSGPCSLYSCQIQIAQHRFHTNV